MRIDHSEAAPKMGRAALASVLVALTLVIAKGVVWLASGSVALLGSWLDSFLDLMASLINMIAVRAAVVPPDKEHRFGHGKAEAIAGLFQCSLILISALFLLYASARHLIAGEALLRGGWAIGVSVLAIVLTFGLVAYQRQVVRQTGSVAIEADSLHYTGDLLLNLAVIAAVALSSYAGFVWADGLFGMAIAFYLGWAALRIFRKSVDILMDREFLDEEREAIFNLVMGNKEVLGLHDMKTRRGGLTSFIQMHIEVKSDLSLFDAHQIADEVEATVGEAFPNTEIIIHTDPLGLEEPDHTAGELD
ncbi:MAG: cation diffusion facilitator family transporter [Proteobacteria bacterium]|nr:cation diffusion facilitator family transporter [Pseudomonadota bacterium]